MISCYFFGIQINHKFYCWCKKFTWYTYYHVAGTSLCWKSLLCPFQALERNACFLDRNKMFSWFENRWPIGLSFTQYYCNWLEKEEFNTESNALNQSELVHFSDIVKFWFSFWADQNIQYVRFHHFHVRYVIIHYINLYVNKNLYGFINGALPLGIYFTNGLLVKLSSILKCLYQYHKLWSTYTVS